MLRVTKAAGLAFPRFRREAHHMQKEHLSFLELEVLLERLPVLGLLGLGLLAVAVQVLAAASVAGVHAVLVLERRLLLLVLGRIIAKLGVAVVVECVHMCMMARGVQKTTATTTTSSVLGVFAEDPKTRAEFFSHIDNKRLRTFM